jgi:hypothetical protein
MNLIMLLSPASCYLLFGRIYLSTMFSNTLSLCSPLNVKAHSETMNLTRTAVKYSVLLKIVDILAAV